MFPVEVGAVSPLIRLGIAAARLLAWPASWDRHTAVHIVWAVFVMVALAATFVPLVALILGGGPL